MKKENLPQGDQIRQLLVKSNITNANINSLLRGKGVFLGHNEKNNSVPLLMKSIIAPKDFEILYETQKTKEESIKYRTSSIKCSDDFVLTDVFSGKIDLNDLIRKKFTYKTNYKVSGNPTFYFEDENTAIFNYQIERENLLNDWTDNQSIHSGSITLKKVSDTDIQISVQQNTTSKETFEVNSILMNVLKEKLFEKKIIKSNDDIITVKFSHFDNSSRVMFFYSFMESFNIYIEYLSVTDIEINIDEKVVSHADVKQFLDEIENLKINGRDLQNHILLRKAQYYPKLIFSSVKLRYKFNYMGKEAFAIITLSFPEYLKNKEVNSEFQVSIDLVLNKQDRTSSTEKMLTKKLLEIFETKKIESYNKFKKI